MKTPARWLAWLALAVVIVGVGAYLAHGLEGAPQVSRAKRQAAADIEATLPATQQQLNRDRSQLLAEVTPRWGRPAYSWQELICVLDTRDAGWIVEGYRQECRIRSIDLIPSARVASERCEPVATPGAASTGAVEPTSSVAVVRGPGGALTGQNAYEMGCPDGITEPPPYGATRLLTGARPTNLGASAGWIVVSADVTVSSTDLGCSPWHLLSCSAPVDQPVMGDLP